MSSRAFGPIQSACSPRSRLRRLVRRVLTLFATLVFCFALAVGLLLASRWLEHNSRIDFNRWSYGQINCLTTGQRGRSVALDWRLTPAYL